MLKNHLLASAFAVSAFIFSNVGLADPTGLLCLRTYEKKLKSATPYEPLHIAGALLDFGAGLGKLHLPVAAIGTVVIAGGPALITDVGATLTVYPVELLVQTAMKKFYQHTLNLMTQLQRFGEEALVKKVEDLSELETYKVLVELEEFKGIKQVLKNVSDSEIAATLLRAYLESSVFCDEGGKKLFPFEYHILPKDGIEARFIKYYQGIHKSPSDEL